MEKLAGFVLLFAALNVARAQDKTTPKYFKDGGGLTLELRPRPAEPITNVLWKHQGDLVAEWFKDKATGEVLVALTYYRSFNGRATMDVTTGRLDINNMAKADAGVYSAEVNSVGQIERYSAVMIKEVPEPVVEPRPLVCSSASDGCTLTCEADPAVLVDAGPVTYSWKKGDGGWTESGKDLDITKEGTAGVETFTCRIENPVSVRESKPKENPLLVKEPGSSNTGAIAGGIIGVLVVVVVAVGVGVYFRKTILKFLGYSRSDAPDKNGRQPETASTNPGAAAEELGSLNGPTNQDGEGQD